MSHENLLPLFGIFSDEDYVYLILELMPDGNVQQLRKRKNMSEKQVAYLVRQVAEGLKALHCERVIHRDLKPENLLLIDVDSFQYRVT